MNIGDTIRVLRDEPDSADIKAGACGVVTGFVDDSGVRVSFGAGIGDWAFQFSDVEVVHVEDVFTALTTALTDVKGSRAEDIALLTACYEPSETSRAGTPLELPVQAECADCSDGVGLDGGPHHHVEGLRVELPFLDLNDAHGDLLQAIDTRSMISPDDMRDVGLIVLIHYESGDRLHVNLTEDQAIALTAFLLKTYMGRS